MTYHETQPRYLTGITRQRLEDWFAAHPVTDEDRESAEIADVDPDGMIRWRRATVNEQVAYFIAKWIWDEAVEVGE